MTPPPPPPPPSGPPPPPPRRRRAERAEQPPGPSPGPPSGPPSGPPAQGAGGANGGGNPGRLYILTGAAEDGDRAAVDLVTLIVRREDDGGAPASVTPEQSALLRLCGAPLSAAELSAYLGLPFSVVTVLLTELLAAGLVQARAPIVRQALPDRSLLEAVMHGLQRL